MNIFIVCSYTFFKSLSEIWANRQKVGWKRLNALCLLALRQIKYFEKKNCFYCNSIITKKNGKKNGKQLYKCCACGKQFVGGNRIIPEIIWNEYVTGKRTYTQLSIKYGCSKKTIQRKIDSIITTKETNFPSMVNVLMDTTYFGRSFGVLVFKDSISFWW